MQVSSTGDDHLISDTEVMRLVSSMSLPKIVREVKETVEQTGSRPKETFQVVKHQLLVQIPDRDQREAVEIWHSSLKHKFLQMHLSLAKFLTELQVLCHDVASRLLELQKGEPAKPGHPQQRWARGVTP